MQTEKQSINEKVLKGLSGEGKTLIKPNMDKEYMFTILTDDKDIDVMKEKDSYYAVVDGEWILVT